MRPDKYMWASVQTIRGCPKHCSFCSVWRTDGQKPRQRSFQKVIDEIVSLRRLGFRFIALADDNFYPVTLTDLRLAREQKNFAKVEELTTIRNERFQLMEELAKLPKDMVFFTQITMEAGEDGEYLDAMRKANIKGALVGVEAVTPEGLKAVFKDWNYSGEALAKQLQTFKTARRSRAWLVHLRIADGQACDLRRDGGDGAEGGSDLCAVRDDDAVSRAPSILGGGRRSSPRIPTLVGDVPITRYWLIPTEVRPKMFTPHPSMSSDEIRERTQRVWDRFYNWSAIWQRSACTPDSARADRVHFPLQTLPADVCGHGNFDGQRAPQEVEELGAMDCEAVQEAVPGQADAGIAVAGVARGSRCGRCFFGDRFSACRRAICGSA